MSRQGDTDALAAALMQVAEVMKTVVEAASGYRAQLVAAGFPEQQAAEMTVPYHAQLVRMVLASQAGPDGGGAA